MLVPAVNIFAPFAQVFSFAGQTDSLGGVRPLKSTSWKHLGQSSTSYGDPTRMSSTCHRDSVSVCDTNERDA